MTRAHAREQKRLRSGFCLCTSFGHCRSHISHLTADHKRKTVVQSSHSSPDAMDNAYMHPAPALRLRGAESAALRCCLHASSSQVLCCTAPLARVASQSPSPSLFLNNWSAMQHDIGQRMVPDKARLGGRHNSWGRA